MRERVVMKLGGGLITQKDQLKVPNLSTIDNLVEQISNVMKEGFDVILVHGAGSYGHLKAKEYRLSEGRIEGFESPLKLTQRQAIEEVRNDMMELNDHIMKALTKQDITAISFPPHQWAKGTGPNFEGDLSPFIEAPRGIVTVTFGDVVPCDEPKLFGILSGDDLVARLSIEVPNVKRLVFAIGGVDGVLSQPPHLATAEDLIEILSPETVYVGEHKSAIDVTGGIGLKVQRGLEVAANGIEVVMVSGEYPERVYKACIGGEFRGTRFKN